MFKFFLSLISLIIIFNNLDAQAPASKVVQFSGVVVSGDSLQPVPYANIITKGTFRGTVSDFFGFYSFVAQENDTVEFSSLGYKKSYYVIPTNLPESRYSIIQVLNKDTFELATTVIYAWPTREQIYEYFLTAPVPDDDVERARKNLAQEKISDMAINMPMDASMNFRNSMSNFNTRLYTAGQIPMNNLLNPIAWAKFVEAWKKGDFKKKSN